MDVIVDIDLLVAFGGVNLKNTGINHGGTTGHPAREALARFREQGRQHCLGQPAAR